MLFQFLVLKQYNTTNENLCYFWLTKIIEVNTFFLW